MSSGSMTLACLVRESKSKQMLLDNLDSSLPQLPQGTSNLVPRYID